MRKALTMAFMAAFAVAALGAQTAPPSQAPPQAPQKTPAPAPSIVGKWTMELVTDSFTATPALEFFKEGDKITGTYESSRYGKFPFTATLKGTTIAFNFTMSAEGSDVAMAFKGEVAPDFKLMKGTAELAGLGSATWSAKPVPK